MSTTTESSATRSLLAVVLVGIAAGVLAGIAMPCLVYPEHQTCAIGDARAEAHPLIS
jgi:hypothetical protein